MIKKEKINTKKANNKRISKWKIVLSIFIVLTFVLTYKYFFGCALKIPILTEHANDIQIDEKMIDVSFKEDTLSRTGVTLILTNNSEYEVYYGSMEVEYSMFNNWFMMVPKRMRPKLLVAKVILPNESKEIEYNWKDEYGRLSLGKYRIIIDTSLSDKYDFEISEKYRDSFVSYEFRI